MTLTTSSLNSNTVLPELYRRRVSASGGSAHTNQASIWSRRDIAELIVLFT